MARTIKRTTPVSSSPCLNVGEVYDYILNQINSGDIARRIQRNTSTTTLNATAYHWFGNTDSTAFTYNLPAGVQGREYRIVNTGSSGNDITITPNGAEKLLGQNSSFILADGESLIITYDETDGWF